MTNSSLAPINISGLEHPTLFGSRVIAQSGATVNVQDTGATPYGTDFTPWLDVSGSGLELRRTDVAANGQLAALELEQWNGGTQRSARSPWSRSGRRPATTFAAVNCFMPTTGVARDASLSTGRDARRVDGRPGLKVAGTPTTADDPCVLTSPPVVISPTASQGAIGGANMPRSCPRAGRSRRRVHGPPPAGGDGRHGADDGRCRESSRPRRWPAPGASLKVKVPPRARSDLRERAGEDPGQRGQPIVVATGSETRSARRNRDGEVRLAAGRAQEAKRLKGARMTLRVSQGGLNSTKRITLR